MLMFSSQKKNTDQDKTRNQPRDHISNAAKRKLVENQKQLKTYPDAGCYKNTRDLRIKDQKIDNMLQHPNNSQTCKPSHLN